MTTRRALWMKKLADEVVRGICERVRRGELPPGTLLGTRDDIASHYVTSAGVARRALETLQGFGVVTGTAGGEYRVAEVPKDARFELDGAALDNLRDVIAVLELRLGVEVEAAALAAQRRAPADLDGVRRAAQDFADAVADGTGAAQADFRFHRAIAVASGNGYIIELIDYLGPLLIPRMRLPSGIGDDSLAMSVTEHGTVLAAIEAGDAAAARKAMRGHLQRTISRVRATGTGG